MSQIVSCSLRQFPATRSFQWRTSYNTRKRLSLSEKRTSLFVRAKLGADAVDSIFEDELEIRSGDAAQKALVSSPTQRCKPEAYPSTIWGTDFIPFVSSRKAEAMDETIHDANKLIEMLVCEIKEKFNSMEEGEISPSAYDTAWLARIPAIDGSHKPQFPQTLKWITENQLRDGSWGLENWFLVSDRILNTLSCIIALTTWNTSKTHVQRGIDFIRSHAKLMMKELPINGTCRAFEMVFHAILNESKSLGLDVGADEFKEISERREASLKTYLILAIKDL